MNSLMQVIDSLLGAFTSKEAMVMPDPTQYQMETTTNTYIGYIIFQDDVMIKFRTTDLKPVKILKRNIIKVTMLSSLGSMKYATA
jgi:F420-dependent methylenetetrahydromethanopterin dehydrogenase